MYEVKNLLGIIATFLVFVGYFPYLRDIIKGKTKPHLYSWFLWAFVTAIAFGLQFSAGAGSGSFVTLAAAIMCVAVIVLGLLQKSKIKIIKVDTVFLILAFIALGLWLIAKQPVLSVILATIIDLLAFVPTIRKTWDNPHTETMSFYFLNALRFGLAVIALQKYNIVTTLYPVSWLITDAAFALMLAMRRKQIPEK